MKMGEFTFLLLVVMASSMVVRNVGGVLLR